MDSTHEELAAFAVIHLSSVASFFGGKVVLVDVVQEIIGQPEVLECPLWSFPGVGQVVVVHLGVGEVSVVTHVVDDEQAPSLLVHTPATVVGGDDERDQACLPVICDEDNLLTKGSNGWQDEGSLNSSPREESKAKEVIEVIVPARLTVHTSALESDLVLNKDAVDTDLGRVGVTTNLGGAPHVKVVALVRSTVELE